MEEIKNPESSESNEDPLTLKEVEKRISDWIKTQLLNQTTPRSIAIFTHEVAIKCLLRNILEYTPHMMHKIKIDHTGITKLRHDENGWHVLYVNNAEHLNR